MPAAPSSGPGETWVERGFVRHPASPRLGHPKGLRAKLQRQIRNARGSGWAWSWGAGEPGGKQVAEPPGAANPGSSRDAATRPLCPLPTRGSSQPLRSASGSPVPRSPAASILWEREAAAPRGGHRVRSGEEVCFMLVSKTGTCHARTHAPWPLACTETCRTGSQQVAALGPGAPWASQGLVLAPWSSRVVLEINTLMKGD